MTTKNTNTHSGIHCKTCRRRGRKCDRALPTCKSCELRGLQCEGYELRWVGLAARGSRVGQTFPVAGTDDPPSRIPPPQGLGPSQNAAPVGDVPAGDPAGDIARVLSDPESATLDTLVKIYSDEFSTAFYLGQDRPETPYTLHVIPMAENVPCIRYIAAATSSCHIANKFDNKRLRTQSLHFRLKAIEALRQQLQDDVGDTDVSSIACMMLLAQLDLCSGDCMEYFTHLKAASDIVQRRGGDGTERAYFQQRLAWMDIMSATTQCGPPTMSSAAISAALNKFSCEKGRTWGFDVFDCPIDLTECIAEANVLHDLHAATAISTEEATQKALALVQRIKTWTAPASSITDNSRVDIIEVWRNGILFYLGRMFKLSKDKLNKGYLLDDVFGRAGRLALEEPRKFATSWPLFQAGMCLKGPEPERKQWLRDEFGVHFATRGCANARTALVVMERIWETGDYGLIQSEKLLF